MRDTLIIRRHDGSLFYKGKLKDLPFNERVISTKSMELFADDDPCVIHRSFVVMQLAEEWKKAFGDEKVLPYNRLSSLLKSTNLLMDESMQFELADQ